MSDTVILLTGILLTSKKARRTGDREVLSLAVARIRARVHRESERRTDTLQGSIDTKSMIDERRFTY